MGLHDEAKLDAKMLDLIKLLNVYLNHFPKHEKYGLALSRLVDEVGRMLGGWINAERASRGINFVGYRTWASKRFVRRHSLYTFRRAVRQDNLESAAAVLGHARHTHSRQHMLNHCKDHNHGLYHRLPQAHHPRHHPRAAPA